MAASYSSMAMSTTAPHPSEKQLKQTLKNTKVYTSNTGTCMAEDTQR